MTRLPSELRFEVELSHRLSGIAVALHGRRAAGVPLCPIKVELSPCTLTDVKKHYILVRLQEQNNGLRLFIHKGIAY